MIPGDKTEELKTRTYNTCEKLINRGITRFVCGGAIGFDMIAAMSVLALRKKYPEIRLSLLLPCGDQDSKWNCQQKMTYGYIKDNADEVTVLHEKFVTGCMQERNKLMVDESSVCVAYLKRSFGGTKSTVDYAKDKAMEVIML